MDEQSTGQTSGLGDQPWVAVAHAPTRALAEAIASALRGSDITARISGDDAGGVLPYLDAMGRGITVDVRADMVPAARALLDSELDPGDANADERAATATGVPTGAEQAPTGSHPDDRPLAARPSGQGWRWVFAILVVVAIVLAVGTGLVSWGG